MRFPRLVDFAHEALAALTFNATAPAADSISSKIWLACQDVATDCLNTRFVQGIGTGTLSPYHYGQYTIQDCAYCVQARDDYQTVEDRASAAGAPELAAFARARHVGYVKYTQQLTKDWHIANDNALTLSPAAQQYIAFEHAVATRLPPIYGVIAQIPCSQLWPWLAEELKPHSPAHNVYGFWISENDTWIGAHRLNNFIDQWFAAHLDEYKWQTALAVFRGCMKGELNMFRSGCGQSLSPMPELPAS